MDWRMYEIDDRLPADDPRCRAYLGGVTVAENDLDRVLTAETCRALTWWNLGFRNARLYGGARAREMFTDETDRFRRGLPPSFLDDSMTL
jgi:hypothetical protein